MLKSESGFVQYLLILILLIGIGVAVYLIQFTQIFKPKAAENKCTANSVDSLKACIAGLNTNQTAVIEITNTILCDQQTVCEFVLNNINRPVTIRGAAGSGAGFRRTQRYNYTFFEIRNSSNITFQNLFFDDLAQPCNKLAGPPDNTWIPIPDCGPQPQMYVEDSNNITLDAVSFLHAQSFAFQARRANFLVIRNSKFIDPGQIAVWLPTIGCENCTSHSVKIDNNLFTDSSTEALLYGMVGTAQNPSTLNNNLLVHNHQRQMHANSGSTLALPRMSHAEIKGNAIYGNKVENNSGYISGAGELGLMDNAVISGNSIHDNSGGSIGLAVQFDPAFRLPPEPGWAQNFRIERNKLYNNNNLGILPTDAFGNMNFPFMGSPAGNLFPADKFIGLPYFDLAQLQRDNCETATCAGYPPVKLGKIYADPAVCILQSAQGQCETTLKWRTNDAENVQIKMRETGAALTGVGANPNSGGSVSVNAAGTTFDLYSDGALLDSVFVKGVGSVQPSPSPSLRASPSSSGTLTANPNPCSIIAGHTDCRSNPPKITWNVTNPTGNIVVRIRETGQDFAGGALSGTADAWFVTEQGVNLDLFTGTTLLSSVSVIGVRINSAPIGIFDGVFGSQLLGWACDIDIASSPINVEYNIDGLSLGYSLADKPGAAGIAQNCGGFPNHRFIIDIPNQYKDGKIHTVSILALNNIRFAQPNIINGSPKTFNIAASSPSPSSAPKIGNIEGNDNDVDLADFTLFIEDYKSKNLRSDFNKDGKVDLGDFALLAENFGK